MSEPKLFGVVVTFRRPAALATMLRRLRDQDRRLDGLVVVDNDPSPENRDVVSAFAQQGLDVEYVPASENLGPAGGRAVGMERVLGVADDRDWIVCLDDDEPPQSSTTLGALLRFGQEMLARDPQVGAVGAVGGRFDWKRGLVVRVRDEELTGPVRVESIGGGQLPFFRVRAIRDAGVFSRDLFFGFEELELGLRLRKSGYSLYADGVLWRERRRNAGRLGLDLRPSRGVGRVTWRRYYSLRNTIFILRTNRMVVTALRVTILHGLAKPLVNLAVSPLRAARHLGLNVKACRDAWTGRLGRTVEPDSGNEMFEPEQGTQAQAVRSIDSEVGA